jgi:DNA-binding NtrC family response regulator
LVVDDEAVIRGVFSEFLKDSGYQTISVASADEAVRLLSSGLAVDLIFSDVRMPGKLDGFGLARWVMENRSPLPVILVSGDIGKANAAVELCGAEIFPKPYDFDSAVRKIRDALARSRPRRA